MEIPSFKKQINDELLQNNKKKKFLKSIGVVIASILLALGISSQSSANIKSDQTNLKENNTIQKAKYLYVNNNSSDIMQSQWHYSH